MSPLRASGSRQPSHFPGVGDDDWAHTGTRAFLRRRAKRTLILAILATLVSGSPAPSFFSL
jgi:hypothetical protein